MPTYSQLEKENSHSLNHCLTHCASSICAVLFPVVIPSGPSQSCPLLVNKIFSSAYLLQTVLLELHTIVTVVF